MLSKLDYFIVLGWVDDNKKNDVSDTCQLKMEVPSLRQNDGKGNQHTAEVETTKETNVREDVKGTPGDINMEASILPDDVVVRAGGFGARDDMSSFLPVASDSTDFEASLLNAREYEEPQEEIRRPGLGWTNAQK